MIPAPMLLALGTKMRKQRNRRALTLDDLADLTGISKPYLSLIENAKIPNPPSDQKLRLIESALHFPPGELVSHAHLARTPRDIRDMLQQLVNQRDGATAPACGFADPIPDPESQKQTQSTTTPTACGLTTQHPSATIDPNPHPRTPPPDPQSEKRTQSPTLGINLDQAYLAGILHQLAQSTPEPNLDPLPLRSVPVVNKVAAGYPADFTDLAYPPRIADDYTAAPDLADPDTFAARVHGDSMAPKYAPGDIVIFSPAADIRDGDDCFVRFDSGQTTFKRAYSQTTPKGEEQIRLVPRNKKYPEQTHEREQIAALYRAVYKQQRVDVEED